MGKTPIPVTILGTEYPSQASAARALGINSSEVSQAMRADALELLEDRLRARGVKPKPVAQVKHDRQPVPVTIFGTDYPSLGAARRAFGVADGLLSYYVKNNAIDRLEAKLRAEGKAPKPAAPAEEKPKTANGNGKPVEAKTDRAMTSAEMAKWISDAVQSDDGECLCDGCKARAAIDDTTEALATALAALSKLRRALS